MSKLMRYTGRKETHGEVVLEPGKTYRTDIFSDGKSFRVNVYNRIENSFCTAVTIKEYDDPIEFYLNWSAAEERSE